MKRLLLIVLFISVGLSQQEWNMKFIEEYGGVTYAPNSKKPYTGKVYSFYESGETKEEGKYRNGLKDGKWTHFRYGGQKDREEIYKDGKEIEKTSWTYYENGQKKSEETYKDGKRDGLWTGWYENGQKKAEGTRKDGNKDGLWTGWYENGQKNSERTWKDREQISSICWDEDGNECECHEYGSCDKDDDDWGNEDW